MRISVHLLLVSILVGCSLDWSEPAATGEPDGSAGGGTRDGGHAGANSNSGGTSGRNANTAGDNGAAGDDGTAGDGGAAGGLAPCVGDGCDPCAGEPCRNGGLCSRAGSLASCACLPGYSGDTCAIDACEIDPCLHAGSCRRVGTGRQCECVPPWFGAGCEQNDDAALVALEPSAGSLWPAFDPDVTEYSVDLGFADKNFALTPTARVPEGVSIRVEGTNLASGTTSAAKGLAINTSDGFTIEVASNTGQRKTYSVTVRRSLVQRAYLKNFGSLVTELFFGSAMAMNEHMLMIGAPGAGSTMARSGIVDMVKRTRSTFIAGPKLLPPNPQEGASFGAALAMAGKYLVVSAPGEDEGSTASAGAVYVFTDDGNGFASPQRLQAPDVTEAANFGTALALAGNVLVVEAAGRNKVFVYRRSGATWAFEVALPASSAAGFFHKAVATDGGWIAIGGEGRAVQLYRHDPATGEWQLQAPLLAKRQEEKSFGTALAFHGDQLAVVSGYTCLPFCEGLPRLYTYSLEGDAWTLEREVDVPVAPAVQIDAEPSAFGSSLAFDGRTLLTSASGEGLAARGVFPGIPTSPTGRAAASGAGYLYDLSGVDIELNAYLKASNAESEDLLGAAVVMSSGVIAISATGEDSNASGINPAGVDDNSVARVGAVYVFGADCSLLPEGASVPGC